MLPIPTASDLKRLFAERGIRPNRLRGQNFLIDPNQMRFIADAAGLTQQDVVLEPGPGPGGLTGLLIERAGKVVAVEIDRGLHEIIRERWAHAPNLVLIHADIMGKSASIATVAQDEVRRAIASIPGARLKVVANLPYAVSTAFITAMLIAGPVPAEMVVMVQLEVAERLAAKPNTDAYGYLSVIVQALARVEPLRRLSPKAFWPQPEVDSAVVRITPAPAQRLSIQNLEHFQKVVSGLFQFRRKQLIRAVQMSHLAENIEDAGRSLVAAGIDPSARCGELTVDQFRDLARVLP